MFANDSDLMKYTLDYGKNETQNTKIYRTI